ncbi:MAG: carboxymuconolactone decarboxylase family protein [Anaerofustis sp.]
MHQKFYKKIYTPKELYIALYRGLRTMKFMRKAKNNHELSVEFIERIMLAVTEVNGCEICSYGHTKMALEQGMRAEEIETLLSGNTEQIPKEELTAILFAQHYADTRGWPSEVSWKRVSEEYGLPKALGILGSTRMIMIGNIVGIAFSALRSRLKGHPVEKTGLLYEIGMLLSCLIFLPIAILHGLISDLFRVPIIRFK